MAIINLRKHYYPLYTKDTFIEVPDEVAEAIIEGGRIEHRQDNKKTYYGVYSLDASPGADEGVSGSCATESVTSAIKKLRKIFAQNGWLEKEV